MPEGSTHWCIWKWGKQGRWRTGIVHTAPVPWLPQLSQQPCGCGSGGGIREWPPHPGPVGGKGHQQHQHPRIQLPPLFMAVVTSPKSLVAEDTSTAKLACEPYSPTICHISLPTVVDTRQLGHHPGCPGSDFHNHRGTSPTKTPEKEKSKNLHYSTIYWRTKKTPC